MLSKLDGNVEVYTDERGVTSRLRQAQKGMSV
jgi:hypothetical protein